MFGRYTTGFEAGLMGTQQNYFQIIHQLAPKTCAWFWRRRKTQAIADEAFTEGDLRWAIELSSVLLEYHNSSEEESGAEMERASRLLANSLRKVAQTTTAANIRNWCLTHALELEGSLNLERHRDIGSPALW